MSDSNTPNIEDTKNDLPPIQEPVLIPTETNSSTSPESKNEVSKPDDVEINVNESTEKKPEIIENKVSEEKTVENKTAEEKTVENKTAEEKTVENKASEEKTAENKVVENKVVEVKVVDYDAISKEGLDILIEKYLEDGVIDSEELVDIVKVVMEIVEKKKEINGQEKKKVALIILRKFIENKIKDYDNLEKLFDKAIDLAVKVSKNGLETIKFSSESISESKSAFNMIYASTMSKINESYPLADDIINNIFDIALFIMQLLEGQTSLDENEKKILLKKIIQKVINSLESKLSIEQRDFLLTQVDPTISLVQIGIRASQGKFEINPVEIVGFFACLTACFRKCCSRSKQK